MGLREDFIDRVKDRFGENLKRKENVYTMDSYYLYEIKNKNGFFWIDEEIKPKGYRVHLQKVAKICHEVTNRDFGDYPCIYLRNEQDVPLILEKLEYIYNHFNDRISNEEENKIFEEVNSEISKLTNTELEYYKNSKKMAHSLYEDFIKECSPKFKELEFKKFWSLLKSLLKNRLISYSK